MAGYQTGLSHLYHTHQFLLIGANDRHEEISPVYTNRHS